MLCNEERVFCYINFSDLLWKKNCSKATSKQEGPKNFGVPEKTQSFFPYKRTAFLSGAPNFFGTSCFEAALEHLQFGGSC